MQGAPTIGNPGPGSGALTIGTNLTVRSGAPTFLGSYDGGVIVNTGSIIVDPPVPASSSQTTDIDLGFNFGTNSPCQLINNATIEVRTGALARVVVSLHINIPTAQFRHFINDNAFVVDSGGKRRPSLRRTLENAFRHYGGVPMTVIIDNLKAGGE